MNTALWVVQGLLAAAFLMAGGMKLFAYERYMKMLRDRSPADPPTFSKGLVTFIGASEVAGALGLILPMAAGIAPHLTGLAALGLAIVMALAAGFHLNRKEAPTVPVALLVLCGFVVYGRGPMF